MWIIPEEVLLANALWVSERANPFFILQRRKGHGKGGGIAGLLVGTLDVVLDSSARVAPYRILHQTQDSQIYWSIACGSSRKEITEHWHWLEVNLLQTLSIFDNEEDITTFVKGKIQKLGACSQVKKQLLGFVIIAAFLGLWRTAIYTNPRNCLFSFFFTLNGSSRKEITEHWDWLEANLLQTLSVFDNEEDITTFVKGKIQGIIAEENKNKEVPEDEDSGKFREAELKMRKLFGMPDEEKLVNYYSCSYWKGRVPRQGWVYLSVNHLCFYSFLLGKEVTLVIQWTDVTQLEKNATLLFPESIRVSTRDTEDFFSMFLNINETFKLMEQLANIAMRQLLDNEAFSADRSLPKPRKAHKNISTLKRLPQSEKLDGHTDCTLWTPFSKMHIVGQMFVSNNYICFSSKEEDLCHLIIPLREASAVSVVEKADSSSVLPSPLSISTKNKMTFLFANLKDRDFLVQRISDFLQRTPDKQQHNTKEQQVSGSQCNKEFDM
ncbi:UNVERIFIED_CONTAM: hypothetical protein FKN15_012258 [Acipenser sinensis]